MRSERAQKRQTSFQINREHVHCDEVSESRAESKSGVEIKGGLKTRGRDKLRLKARVRFLHALSCVTRDFMQAAITPYPDAYGNNYLKKSM